MNDWPEQFISDECHDEYCGECDLASCTHVCHGGNSYDYDLGWVRVQTTPITATDEHGEPVL